MTTNLPNSGLPSALPLYPTQLELAPEGWRACMEKIAAGFAEVVKNEAVCLLCGGTLHRGVGHTLECLTMRARRMIIAEVALRARFEAEPPHWSEVYRPLPVRYVDIDAVYPQRAAAT